MAEPGGHAPRFANAAVLCLTLAALVLNHVSLASNDYLGVVLAAVGLAIATLVLIASTWKRQSSLGRLISVLAVLANSWTLLDALGRRLPALLQG